MALVRLLKERSTGPYSRPPPLTVAVVAERMARKVLRWNFSGEGCTPAVEKANKIIAICDGDSVAKVTLFEQSVTRMQSGRTYILKNFDVQELQGMRVLNVKPSTSVFSTAPLLITGEQKTEGERLISPPSPLADITAMKTVGLMSLEGRLVEMAAVQKIANQREEYPVRKVTIEKRGVRVAITLWREAILLPTPINAMVRYTHVKWVKGAPGEYLAQSTSFTQLEELKSAPEEKTLTVKGVEDRGDTLILLLDGDDGEEMKIKPEVWKEAVGEDFYNFPLVALALVEDMFISQLKKVVEEEICLEE